MKILYINSLDKRYGSTYRSRNIVKALISLGHKVQYVESNLKDKIFENSLSIIQKDNLVGYFVATCRRVLSTLKLDYDILYLQKLIPLTVPCLIIGKLRRKKCIVDWDDLDFSFQQNFAKKIIVFLSEHMFPYFADCITTHSHRLKKYAYRLGIRNVKIVNQIVDFNEFNISDEEKERLREQIGAKGKKILCFLGTLTLGGARDLDVIIRAVSSVAAKRNDIFFLIIGGGPLEEKFSNMLKKFGLVDISYITGLISHLEVKRFLSIADLGLIYMRNNLGNRMRVSFKVLEYLSVGLTVAGQVVGETKRRLSKYINSLDLSNIKNMEGICLKENEMPNNYQSFIEKNYSFSVIKEDIASVL
ncbi:MAG: glycosyltransferase [Candidatus Omnitrophica bacterium]|nr:glycosyltransferase [Candidatus Omnitrophota bacterium]